MAFLISINNRVLASLSRIRLGKRASDGYIGKSLAKLISVESLYFFETIDISLGI